MTFPVVSCPSGVTYTPGTWTPPSASYTLSSSICYDDINIPSGYTVYTCAGKDSNCYSMTALDTFTNGGTISATGTGGWEGGSGSGGAGSGNGGNGGNGPNVEIGGGQAGNNNNGGFSGSDLTCSWGGNSGCGGGGSGIGSGFCISTGSMGGGAYSGGGGAGYASSSGTVCPSFSLSCGGGAGGGAVSITALNFYNNGPITANGNDGQGATTGCNGAAAGGGGGGGSINITVVTPNPRNAVFNGAPGGYIAAIGGSGGEGTFWHHGSTSLCGSEAPIGCVDGGGGGGGVISITATSAVLNSIGSNPGWAHSSGGGVYAGSGTYTTCNLGLGGCSCSSNTYNCPGGSGGANGQVQETALGIYPLQFGYVVDNGANSLNSNLANANMLTVTVGSHNQTWTASQVASGQATFLVANDENVQFAYNSPMFFQSVPAPYYTYTINELYQESPVFSCTGGSCLSSGTLTTDFPGGWSSGATANFIVNYQTEALPCNSIGGTTVCIFDTGLGTVTSYNPAGCQLTYTGSTPGYAYSPAEQVNNNNIANAPWFLTAPNAPVMNPRDQSDIYPGAATPTYAAGDQCMSSVSSLDSQIHYQTEVSWNGVSSPQVSLPSFGISNIGALTINEISFTPSVDGEIANNFHTQSYIFFGIPSIAQHDIWSWSAEFADLRQTVPSQAYIPVVSYTDPTSSCSYTFADTINTMVSGVDNSYIPFNEVVDGQGNKFNTFDANILPYFTLNYSLPGPYGASLNNSYDLFGPWNYNTPSQSIDPYPIDLPSKLFVNVNNSLQSADLGSLEGAPFYCLPDSNGGCSHNNGPQDPGSILGNNAGTPGWVNPNIPGPISVAAISNDYIFVLNMSGGNYYYLTILRVVPHGQYNASGYQPGTICSGTSCTSQAQWNGNWQSYFNNLINLQDQEVYVARSILLGPGNSGSGAQGVMASYENTLYNHANHMMQVACGGSVTNQQGNSQTSPNSPAFTPLNITADNSGDVFITGAVQGVNPSSCTTETFPGVVKVSNTISGNPTLAANTTWLWSNTTSTSFNMPVTTEITSSPDGSLVFLANQTDYLSSAQTGFIYTMFGKNLTSGGSVDLTYRQQIAGYSSSVAPPVNITSYLQNSGLYHFGLDIVSALQGSGISTTLWQDTPGYHHPLGLTDVNGYLYVLDNWAPSDFNVQDPSQGGGAGGQATYTQGVWFSALELRALTSNGTDLQINPTGYDDIGTNSPTPGGVYPPYGWPLAANVTIICSGNNAAGNLGFGCLPGDGIYQLETTRGWGLTNFNPSCSANNPPYGEIGNFRGCGTSCGPYTDSSGNGWTGGDYSSINFCSGSSTTCLDKADLTNGAAKYTGAFYPIGPTIQALGPWVNTNPSGATQGTCNNGAWFGAGLGAAGYTPLYFGVSLGVSFNGSIDILMPNVPSLPIINYPGSSDTWSYQIQQNANLWDTFAITKYALENYTKQFGGLPQYQCYTSAGAYALPGNGNPASGADPLSTCNYLSTVDNMEGPAYTVSDPFTYAENLGSPQLLTAAGYFSSSYPGGGSFSVNASCQDINVTNSTGCVQNANGGYNGIANIIYSNATGITTPSVPSLIGQPETLSARVSGYAVIPYSYTYRITQTASNLRSSPGSCSAPNLQQVGPTTVYTSQIVNGASNWLTSIIEGGDTYLQYSGTPNYYIANISDLGTIIPPQIALNLQNDRLLGEAYVNLTAGASTNLQNIINATKLFTYQVNTYKQGANPGYENINSNPILPQTIAPSAIPGPYIVQPNGNGFESAFTSLYLSTTFLPSQRAIDEMAQGTVNVILQGDTAWISPSDPLVLTVTGNTVETYSNGPLAYAQPGAPTSLVYSITSATAGVPIPEGAMNFYNISGMSMSGNPNLFLYPSVSAQVVQTYPSSIANNGIGDGQISATDQQTWQALFPGFVSLFDLYKETIYNSPLDMFINGDQYNTANPANHGFTGTSNTLGYQRLVYVFNDRFNNTIYAPLDADLANITSIQLTVQPSVQESNANQTTVHIDGTVGYKSDFGTKFSPLPNGDVYLYYGTDMNFVAQPIPANITNAQFCAFGGSPSACAADKSCSIPVNCTKSNPVWRGYPGYAGNLQPNNAVVEYNTAYNSLFNSGATPDTCMAPPKSLFSPTTADCNIYGVTKAVDGLWAECNTQAFQPNSGSVPTQGFPTAGGSVNWFCEPLYSNGTGICTPQIGLIGIAKTSSDGVFSTNVVACGIGTALITAEYYGSPSPQPILVSQAPLVDAADPFYSGASDKFIAVNYTWSPNMSTLSTPIGLLELGYGNIDAAGLAAIAAVAAVLLFTAGRKRRRAHRTH